MLNIVQYHSGYYKDFALHDNCIRHCHCRIELMETHSTQLTWLIYLEIFSLKSYFILLKMRKNSRYHLALPSLCLIISVATALIVFVRLLVQGYLDGCKPKDSCSTVKVSFPSTKFTAELFKVAF